MGRLEVFLLVLLVAVATDATEKKQNWLHSRAFRLPQQAGCQNIQSFDRGRNYVYQYDATVETENSMTDNIINGMRLKCDDVMINIPSACFAVLKVDRCTVYESRQLSGGSLLFDVVSPTSIGMQKKLSAHPLYFSFNQGEITKIYFDGNETTDILNIKRSMISALQLKFSNPGFRQPLKEPKKHDEVNIFGAGKMTAVVESFQDSFARNVRVERTLNNYTLPWSRKQWATFHTAGEDLEIMKLVSDTFVQEYTNTSRNAMQTCDMVLERGRHVVQTRCVETRPTILFNNTVFQTLMQAGGMYPLSSNATIRLMMRQLSDERMLASHRVLGVELYRLRNFYQVESLMFEEQWQESMNSSFAVFDPIHAIECLVTIPENKTTPALYAKLARYVARSSEQEVASIWNTISQRYQGLKLDTASNIWVQILYRCSSSKNLCPLPQCQPSLACQNAIGNITSTTSVSSWSPTVKRAILSALSSIPQPNITIVSAAVKICRSNSTPSNVIMLGKVMTRYAMNPNANKQAQEYLQAKTYLLGLLRTKCDVQSPETEEKRVMIAAMKNLGALADEGIYAMEKLIACALNVQIPSELSLNAIRAMKDIPIEENSRYRNQVLSILSNADRPVNLRLACYLFIITKDATVSEIQTISHVAQRPLELRALRFYISEHIKSQLTLRDTSFCDLSDRTIQNLKQVVRRGQWDLGINVDSDEDTLVEKYYEMKQPLFIPILNKELNCTLAAKLVNVKHSLLPMVVNITVSTQVIARNITLLEAQIDLSKIRSVLEPLFGDKGIFPEQGLSQLLKLPLSQLLSPNPRKEPLLESTVLQRLLHIQDEGSLAYSMLMMKNKSPLDLKLFGVTVDFETISGLSFMRNMNLMDMWKMVDTLERGWSFNGGVADQPVLANSAFPTSMGTPQVFQMEFAYIHNMSCRIVAQVKKILLTGEGEISINSTIRTEGSLSWIQKVQLQTGASTGCGYLLSAVHNSSVNATMKATGDKLTINITPLPRLTELASVKLDQTIVKGGELVVVEQIQTCPSKCIYGDCASGNSIYYKACVRPTLEYGLFVQSNAENYYEVEGKWGSREVRVLDAQVPSEAIEWMLKSKADRAAEGQDVMRIVGYNIPSMNRVQLEVSSENKHPWIMAANAALYYAPTTDLPARIQGMFASLNVTNSSGIVEYTNLVKMTEHDQEDVSLIQSFYKVFAEQFGDQKSAHTQPRYSIEAGVQLPRVGNLSASGMAYLKQAGGYSAKIQVRQGNLDDPQEQPFCVVNISSVPIRELGLEGFKTEAVIGDITLEDFPYTFFNLSTKVMNDSQGHHVQEMDCHVFKKQVQEPYFFHSLIHLNQSDYSMQSGKADQAHPFSLNCTFTVNVAQLQFDIVAPNMTHIDVVKRYIVPKSFIPYAKIDGRCSHQTIRISENDRELNPSGYELLVCSRFDNSSSSDFSLKANLTSIQRALSKYEKPRKDFYNMTLSVKPSNCSGCHEFSIDSPNVKVFSKYENSTHSTGHTLSVDLHESTLPYFPVSDKTKNAIKAFSRPLSSNRLKMGYTIKAKLSQNSTFLEVGYELGDKAFNSIVDITLPSIICLGKEMHIFMNTSCKACLPFYPIAFNYGFGVKYANRIPAGVTLMANDGTVFEAFLGYNVQDGQRTNIFTRYNTAWRGTKMVDMVWDAKVFYTAGNSMLKKYFPHSEYKYETGMNMSLIQEVSGSSQVEVYNVSMIMGILPEAPLLVGNYTISEVDPSQHSDVCRSGVSCYVSKVSMVENTKCSNYTAFFTSLGQTPRYSAANCTRLSWNITSSIKAWKSKLLIDGQQNADIPLNRLTFNSSKDLRRNMYNSLSANWTRQVGFLPQLFNATYNQTQQDYAVEFYAYTDKADVHYQQRSNSYIMFNSTTVPGPVAFNCSLYADLSNSEKVMFNVPKCVLGYPLITSNGPVNVVATGMYKSLLSHNLHSQINKESEKVADVEFTAEGTSGRGRIQCVQGNRLVSPCDIKMVYNSNQITGDSRINSSLLNNTATWSLSGFSTWQPTLESLNSEVLSFDIESNNSLSLGDELAVYDGRLKCHNGEQWLIKSMMSYGKYLSSGVILNRGKLEHLHMLVNTTYSSLFGDSWLSYFRYVSDTITDIEVFFETKVGTEVDFATGWYNGLNRADSPFYFESGSEHSYLQAVYFNTSSCLKNNAIRIKELYSHRPENILSKLDKMETVVRSNYRPLICTYEWQMVLDQLFPTMLIAPMCNDEFVLISEYDKSKNHEIFFQLYKERQPIAKAVYTQENHVQKLKFICSNESDPSCNVTISLSKNVLQIDSMMKNIIVNHTCQATFAKSPSQQLSNLFGMNFQIQTNNSIVLMSYPLALDAQIIYEHEQDMFVYWSLNSTADLANILVIDQGKLQTLNMHGNNIYILAQPRSWNVTYRSMETSDMDIFASVFIDRETSLKAAYYSGQNQPGVYLHQSKSAQGTYLRGAVWNYTSCGSHALMMYKNVYASKEGDLNKMESIVNITMWPFVNEAAWVSMVPSQFAPQSQCYPFCFGDLRLAATYDSEVNNLIIIKALLARTVELSMNYSLYLQRPGIGFDFMGQTEMYYNINVPNPSHVFLGFNVTMLPNERVAFKVKALTEGLNWNFMNMSQVYEYRPSQLHMNEFGIDCDAVSFYSLIKSGERETELIFRYPNKSNEVFAFAVTINGDDFVIHDAVWQHPFSLLSLERVTITLLRDNLHWVNGVAVRDLALDITPLKVRNAVPMRIVGNSRVQKGSAWNIDIHDTQFKNVNITMKKDASKDWIVDANGFIRIPIMEMDMRGFTRWTDNRIAHTYNMSMMYINSFSGKMRPLLQVLGKQDLKKAENNMYVGDIIWAMNVWSLWSPSFYWNPRITASLKQTSGSLKQSVDAKVFFSEQSFINSTIRFSETCQTRIPYYKNKHMCVPELATFAMTSRLPFVNATHTSQINRGSWKMQTAGYVFQKYCDTEMCKPVLNYTLLDTILIKEHVLETGSWNVTGYVLEPIVYRYESNFTVSSVPQGNAKKYDYAFILGDYPPAIVNISAPSSSNVRSLVFRALDTEMATASFVTSACGIHFPVFPRQLCLPQRFHMSDINADIPLSRFFKQIPVLGLVVPDTSMIDIELKNSDFSLDTTENGDSWRIDCRSHISRSHTAQPLDVQTTISRNSNNFDWKVQFVNTEVLRTLVTWNTDDLSFTYDSQLVTPWLVDHFRFVSSGMTKISEIIVLVKTKGSLNKYLPINIDWKYEKDHALNTWKFNIKSFAVKVGDIADGNLSMGIDSTLKNVSLGWEIMSENYPIINNIFKTNLLKLEDSQRWKLDTAVSNVFVWMNSSSSIGSSHFEIKNMTIGLPDNSKGVIAVFHSATPEEMSKLVMTLKDSAMIDFVCTFKVRNSDVVVMDCQKQERRPVTAHYRSVPTTEVARAQMQLSTFSGIKALTDIISFNFSEAKGKQWIKDKLFEVLGMNDEQLKDRLSQYIVDEVEKLSHKLRVVSNLDIVQNLVQPISKVVSSVPKPRAIVEYVNDALQVLELLSRNTVQMKVINGTNFVALRCNITCPDSRQIMMQVNLTSTMDGLPVANLTIETPFFSYSMLVDSGLTLMPRAIRMKSQESESEWQWDFNCGQPGEQCISSNITTSTGNHYKCQFTKNSPQDTQWHCSCYSVEQFGSTEHEVARFNIDTITALSTLKTLFNITMKSLSGELEHFFQSNLHIVNQQLATDLAKEVHQILKVMEQVYDMHYPEHSSVLFKALAKEGISVLTHHLDRYVSQELFNTDYEKLVMSLYKYISSVLEMRTIKVPIYTLQWKDGSADLIAEVTSTSPRKIALVMHTKCNNKPALDSEARIDFWFNDKKSMMELSTNNTFIVMWTQINLSETKLVRASVGIPESRNNVTIESVRGPYAYDINFCDVENSTYTCEMRQSSGQMVTVRCVVRVEHEPEPTDVCIFTMSQQSLKIPQLMGRIGLMLPEIYEASYNPILFKAQLSKTLGFTDTHSLNVIADFLSRRSKLFTDKFHVEIVDFYANQLTSHALSLYDEASVSKVLSKIMSYPRLTSVARGESTIGTELNNGVVDLALTVFSNLISANKTIVTTINQFQNMSSKWGSQKQQGQASSTALIRDLIKRSYFLAETWYEFEYMCMKMIHQPKEIPQAFESFIRKTYIIEYIMSFYTQNVGPSYQWFKGPSRSQVISYNGQYFDLPIMDTHSNCMYLHATDPLYNSMNIITMGSSILFALPTKTMEITPERRGYLTIPSGERREVNWPYVSDDLVCEATPSKIICKCMDYSATMVFNSNQRIRTTVVVHAAKFIIGAAGVYSDQPVPFTQLLPDATNATSSAQLMNAYVLTPSHECIVEDYQSPPSHGQNQYGPGYEMCKEAFAKPELNYTVGSFPVRTDEYIKACSYGCSGSDMSETCEYVGALVNQVRSKGYPVKDIKPCLKCGDAMSSTPLEKSEVYFLVSLSHNSTEMDPKKSIRKLISKTISRMRNEDLSQSTVGVVTYGGQGDLFKPMMTSINGVTTTSEEEHLIDAIKNVDFNGPTYVPSSTKNTLEFVNSVIRSAPKGVVKCLVVVAPENHEKNLGSLRMKNLIKSFNDDLTSVFLWSPMTEDDCQRDHEEIVTQTRGQCVSCNNGSTRDVVTAVINNIVSKIGSRANCRCGVKNAYTGEQSSQCSIEGPHALNY